MREGMDYEGNYPAQKEMKERAFAMKAAEEAHRREQFLDDHIVKPRYERGPTGIGSTVEGLCIDPLAIGLQPGLQPC